MINTKVTLAGVELKNPVMTASGTFLRTLDMTSIRESVTSFRILQ